MARYTESVCRICRREGAKLFLKGSRCYTKKCAFERRPTPPGQHGVRRRKVGDYGLQLREKQKVRRVYGVLLREPLNPTLPEDAHERQFPCWSVKVMIVLLNDDLMCATP